MEEANGRNTKAGFKDEKKQDSFDSSQGLLWLAKEITLDETNSLRNLYAYVCVCVRVSEI